MDDVYGDTQISSGVVGDDVEENEENDTGASEAIEGDNDCPHADDRPSTIRSKERTSVSIRSSIGLWMSRRLSTVSATGASEQLELSTNSENKA